MGAFTKDKDGNYYIFYAKKDVWLEAQVNNENRSTSVKIPFRSGTCRLEISGDMIAVYFARQMFKASDNLNHQASFGFIFDINTLSPYLLVLLILQLLVQVQC